MNFEQVRPANLTTEKHIKSVNNIHNSYDITLYSKNKTHYSLALGTLLLLIDGDNHYAEQNIA